jgi:hypothetical protein
MEPKNKSGPMPQLFAIVLSLCLGLFLADAFISLADASLILFCGLHVLSAISGLISILSVVMALGIYGLIGLTPVVPKRLFLPIPLFYLLSTLAVSGYNLSVWLDSPSCLGDFSLPGDSRPADSLLVARWGQISLADRVDRPDRYPLL